ncbi:arrestin homolog isoform X1 [Colletes latitarsis]|uniref:arrestin homolog isoform X1 n=1 Tax=Colletes latitarsis TaxID=2605962 RepID=UPI0040371FDF
MAEEERHAEPEATESKERQVPLYPITVEKKKCGNEMASREKMDDMDVGTGTGEKRTPGTGGQAQRTQQSLQSVPQLQPADTQADRRVEASADTASDSFSNQRVYKKSSPNNKLTLYLASRDLIVSESKIDKLQGVLLVDPDYLQDKRVYGQITLTFRYGREDEEVMGLKFCNEAVMCLAQLYPPYAGTDHQETTLLQDALVKRLGPNAHAFTMEITPLAPPSVQLVPAKEYNGAPIGTSYDVRAYVAERADEKLHRKTTVRMGIRVIQRTTRPPLPATTVYSVPVSTTSSTGSRTQPCHTRVTFAENEIAEDEENMGPHAAVEKPFLLSDGRVGLEGRLDRAVYGHGDSITVHVSVNNNSSKSVRRIKVFIVQHVDVCMFSNGKFKNVVALLSSQEGCPVGPGASMRRSYTLRPVKGSTKNWIALEDSYAKAGATLASTVVCPGNGPEDRNVFAIYVSYYVKVKLLISAMGGEVSLKLPFTLMHSNTDPDLVGFPSPVRETAKLLGKIADENTDTLERPDDNGHRYKTSKLEPIKEKSKESRDVDVDLIEHCEEGDST